MSKELIRLRDLTMEFDGERILDGINLYINDHEFLTLLGPSGCGKTTTLRIIGGFLTPTAGTVTFDGKCINDVPPYDRQINTVFQRYALFPHLNVFDNIAFGLKIKNKSKDYINDKIKYALKLVNLDGFENRMPDSLSGGQQQRLALGKVLLLKPDILLLDEPAKGLDSEFKDKLSGLLRQLSEKGTTVLLVSHDIDFCVETADYCSLLFDGELTKREISRFQITR
mgnify:CR=1 FL=1